MQGTEHTPGMTMPATAVMAVRQCTSSACWNHFKAFSSDARDSGSNLCMRQSHARLRHRRLCISVAGKTLTRNLLEENRQDALGPRHLGTIVDVQLRSQSRSFGPAVVRDQSHKRLKVTRRISCCGVDCCILKSEVASDLCPGRCCGLDR